MSDPSQSTSQQLNPAEVPPETPSQQNAVPSPQNPASSQQLGPPEAEAVPSSQIPTSSEQLTLPEVEVVPSSQIPTSSQQLTLPEAEVVPSSQIPSSDQEIIAPEAEAVPSTQISPQTTSKPTVNSSPQIPSSVQQLISNNAILPSMEPSVSLKVTQTVLPPSSQSGLPVSGGNEPSGQNFPGPDRKGSGAFHPSQAPIANRFPSVKPSQNNNPAGQPVLPENTNMTGPTGFMWRPMNPNTRMPMKCPPRIMNSMNYQPRCPQGFQQGFQQMYPPQQMYQQQQMYPPPQMYPQQQNPQPQMYPPQMYQQQQMYPPQRNCLRQQMKPSRRISSPANSNNVLISVTPEKSKVTQTQARPPLSFRESAMAIFDTLTCYETFPCNLCDIPESERECSEEDDSDFAWMYDLLKDILSTLRGLTGKENYCEEAYIASEKPSKVDFRPLKSQMAGIVAPEKISTEDVIAISSSQVAPAELSDFPDGSSHIVQGSIEPFPDDQSLTQYFNTGIVKNLIDGSKTCLTEEDTVYTYSRFNDISNKIAGVLKMHLEGMSTMNPDGDTVIGICIPPSLNLICTIFAILKIGAAYVPFDVAIPENRILRIVNNCKPLLIVSDSFENTIRQFDPVKELVKVIGYSEILEIVEGIERETDENTILDPVQGLPSLCERTAIVLYTSGSSGEPKGVRLSHRAVLNRLNWQWKVLPYIPSEQCVFKTSLTFVDSVCEIFGPLLQGFPLVILSKLVVQNPSTFVQKLTYFGITRVVLVPSLLRAIFQLLKLIDPSERQDLLKSVHLWVVSGELLQKELVDQFFEVFPDDRVMVNLYGSTEMMGDVTYIAFDSKQSVYDKTNENQIPIGTCIYNTIIYILDDQMKPILENGTGEMYVAGYNVAKGYVGNSKSDKFIENPFSTTTGFTQIYRTGDFGRIATTRNGTKVILFEGRIDSQIKVRGQRVDLNEIEYALAHLNLVNKCVVLCYHPGLPDQEIVAFALADPEATVEKLNELLTEKLRAYEMPIIRFVKEIPYLINGKTDRQRLLEIFQLEREQIGEFEDWDSMEIPEENAAAAKVLIKAISKVTGRPIQDMVSNLNESFFNLGGTSLNSIEVIVKLRECYYDIAIVDFVSAKTILEIIDSMVYDSAIEYLASQRQGGRKSIKYNTTTMYSVEKLNDSFKDEVVQMISQSFAKKNELQEYVNTSYQDFATLVSSDWKNLVEIGFSFIVRRRVDDVIVGASINEDLYDGVKSNPDDISPTLRIVFDFCGFVEERQKEKVPKGKGKLMHNGMMGTSAELDESENVNVIQFMEESIIEMAKSMNFLGVFTLNTNPLTQMICRDMLDYEVLEDYQLNQYVAEDGSKPFLAAPDRLTALCCWKKFN